MLCFLVFTIIRESFRRRVTGAGPEAALVGQAFLPAAGLPPRSPVRVGRQYGLGSRWQARMPAPQPSSTERGYSRWNATSTSAGTATGWLPAMAGRNRQCDT